MGATCASGFQRSVTTRDPSRICNSPKVLVSDSKRCRCKTASRKVLETIAGGLVPKSLVALVGYAGWAPGKLENEIRTGSWLPMLCRTRNAGAGLFRPRMMPRQPSRPGP